MLIDAASRARIRDRVLVRSGSGYHRFGGGGSTGTRTREAQGAAIGGDRGGGGGA